MTKPVRYQIHPGPICVIYLGGNKFGCEFTTLVEGHRRKFLIWWWARRWDPPDWSSLRKQQLKEDLDTIRKRAKLWRI